jgi:hypothetical protein
MSPSSSSSGIVKATGKSPDGPQKRMRPGNAITLTIERHLVQTNRSINFLMIQPFFKSAMNQLKTWLCLSLDVPLSKTVDHPHTYNLNLIQMLCEYVHHCYMIVPSNTAHCQQQAITFADPLYVQSWLLIVFVILLIF